MVVAVRAVQCHLTIYHTTVNHFISFLINIQVISLRRPKSFVQQNNNKQNKMFDVNNRFSSESMRASSYSIKHELANGERVDFFSILRQSRYK